MTPRTCALMQRVRNHLLKEYFNDFEDFEL